MIIGFFDKLGLGTHDIDVIRTSRGWTEKDEDCGERFPIIIQLCDL